MDITTVSVVSLSVIFLSTVAGSSLVFLFRNGMGRRTSNAAMGFAGGVMIAAGAMIYITLDEIIPEARKEGLEHIGMWAFMIGFVTMMLLEKI